METRKKYKSQPTVIICENTSTVNSGEVELFFDNNAKNNISINTGKTGVVQQSYKNSETLTIKQSSDKYNNNPYVEFDAGDDGSMLSSGVININVNGVLHKNEPVISFTSGGKTIRGAGNPYLYDNTQPDNGKDFFMFYKQSIIRGYATTASIKISINDSNITIYTDSDGYFEYDCSNIEVVKFYMFSNRTTSLDFSDLDFQYLTYFRLQNMTKLKELKFPLEEFGSNCATVDIEGTDVESLDLSKMNIHSLKSSYFASNYSLTTILLPKYFGSNMQNMNGMFSGCRSLASIDLSNFDTSSCTLFENMFSGCRSLTSIDLSNFDTSLCTSMRSMFEGCNSLTNIIVPQNFGSSCTQFRYMFQNCTSLASLNLNNFNVGNVSSIYCMFNGCTSLTYLDLSTWNTTTANYYGNFVPNVSTLTIDYDSSKWNNDIVSEFNNVNWHDISQAA